MSSTDRGLDPFHRPGKHPAVPQVTMDLGPPPPPPGPPSTTLANLDEHLEVCGIPADPTQRKPQQQEIAVLAERVAVLQRIAQAAERDGEYNAAVNAHKALSPMLDDLLRKVDTMLTDAIEDELEQLRRMRVRAEFDGQATAASAYMRLILEQQKHRDEQARQARIEELRHLDDDRVMQRVYDALAGLDDERQREVVDFLLVRLGLELPPSESIDDPESELDDGEAFEDDDVGEGDDDLDTEPEL